jgi:NADPH-dependent glutamate synthase beta subunit-like oxidoreductase
MNKNVSQTKLPVYIARSRQTTEVNKTGSWRVMCPEYEEKTSPCSTACPAGEDIALIQMLTARGLFKKAWEKILLENPFPAICGRVCYHPCETVCNRKEFDEPVAINSIERFLSDTADKDGYRLSFEKSETKKEKIAIIGAGPAGLSAAWFLSCMGYPCDIFEEKSEPGGILRWGIPAYRLPARVLQREIDLIVAAGAEIHCNRPVSALFD